MQSPVPDYVVGVICGLTLQGDVSIPEIARRAGVSVSTVKRIRHRKGLLGMSRNRGGTPKSWTDDDLDFAKVLLEDGASYRDTAESTGISKDTLRNRFPGMGFSKEDTARIGPPLTRLPEKLRWSLARDRED